MSWTEPRMYRIEVTDPDGKKVTCLVTELQVELFKGGTGEPFSTAAWLGYCDIWARMPEERGKFMTYDIIGD